LSYTICPKCNHTRRPEDEAPEGTCPACGIVFRKWEKYNRPTESVSEEVPKITIYTEEPVPAWRRMLDDYICHCPKTTALAWSGRSLLFAILSLWGGYFFFLSPDRSLEIGESFLHRVNLVFHEAGHVIFMPFGDFMHILGGSLGQVLMPLIVMLAFLVRNRDPFGAAVGLWWIGQSAMDIAIYINDARALELPLLGGGTGYDDPDRHDWNNLLSRLGLLESDRSLAQFTYMMGRLLMLAAWFWGGQVLYRQFRRWRKMGF